MNKIDKQLKTELIDGEINQNLDLLHSLKQEVKDIIQDINIEISYIKDRIDNGDCVDKERKDCEIELLQYELFADEICDTIKRVKYLTKYGR